MIPALRIGILSSAHPPFDPRIFVKQARALADAGYEVHFIVPHERDEIVDGIHIHGIPKVRGRIRRLLGTPGHVLRRALTLQADVYHFHDPELIPVGLMLKALGKRVVYDVHEDVPKSILGKAYLPRWLTRPLSLAAGALEKGSARAFDLVILARDDIQEAFGNSSRTILIRNYPRRDAFTTRPRVDRGDDDFVVAYVGGLTPGRGAIELIEAIGLVPERCRARLVIYGRLWPENLKARLSSMAGFRRVEYRGLVDHDAVPSELARADAGIVCFLPEPNHVNAGPTKLFEYMGAGLPVVASDFPMWREVIEGNHCGLCVDPTRPSAIARAIEYLADHREHALQMGENGRRAVLAAYNWEAEGERLIAAYRELVGPSSSESRSSAHRSATPPRGRRA